MNSPRTLLRRTPALEHPLEARGRTRITVREEPGALVLGRYRLLERLGAGGFGVVWRAHDEQLHRDVALKRIWLGPDGDTERATREALATARLRHPAIVALYEAVPADGAFYLVSELVEGDTLASLIAAGELSDAHVLEIGIALAGALAHAHARGVIHRDIKPHNVLVSAHVAHPRESAKLTDFGGASLAGEDALTRTGNVIGTLAYMAPEQSEGAEVGEQADLYSLALVLYEALCGVNPVRGPTPAATVRRIGCELEPLSRHRRDLPRSLCRALECALAPAPEQRGSLAELSLALEDALEHGLPRRRRGAARRAQHGHGQHRDQGEHGEPSTPVAVLGAQQAPLPDGVARRPALPRVLWLALVLTFVIWEALSGLAGVSLLALLAVVPALFVRGEDGSARLPFGRLSCALAPALGLIGLAGAYPALAGQPRSGIERAARGALGYWWLILATPLLGHTLWLSPSSPAPSRDAWEGSLTLTAQHVIAPALTLGVLLGALVWAAAALVLPWIVRGRRAARDAVSVACWVAALALAERALDSGLPIGGAHPEPRGALLGALLGAACAIAARAVRGPT